MNKTAILLLLLFFVLSGVAEVTLHGVFSDNMVLQRGKPIPVWGRAAPQERVSVTLDGQTVKARAGEDSTWRVQLKARSAGGPYTMVVRGVNTLSLSNVMVGEVWICSGQSNMQWTVSQAANAQAEIRAADWPGIRLFSVKRQMSNVPLDRLSGQWTVCDSNSVGQFSAAGYFFGRDLHKNLNVPIGLIDASWYGTSAQAWTDSVTLRSNPLYDSIFIRRDLAQKQPQHAGSIHDQFDNSRFAAFPAVLYNAMIYPLAPFAVAGAVWYQGESNVDYAWQYRQLLPDLINSWRRLWGQKEFYFGIVQLTNFTADTDITAPSQWAELREAQWQTARNDPQTGIIATIDIGEENDIHPGNKQDVGLRLARWALRDIYKKPIVASGPVYKSLRIDGDKAIVTFSQIGTGLHVDGPTLLGFALCGPDSVYCRAQAVVESDSTVSLSSKGVDHPLAVRYAWANNPPCNLYNKEGLPAFAFRTDSFPAFTRFRR